MKRHELLDHLRRHGCTLAREGSIPLHNPLKTGTLHGILAEVGQMRSMTIESLSELL